MIRPPALSCHACPFSDSGNQPPLTGVSSRWPSAADIPPLRLVRIGTTMPLFLADNRRIGQNKRVGGRGSELALFAPDSPTTPSGFSLFTYTGRRSVPAVSVPRASAVARSERLSVSAAVGIFPSEAPPGFSSYTRRDRGPIEATPRRGRIAYCRLFPRSRRAYFPFPHLPFLRPGGAWQRGRRTAGTSLFPRPEAWPLSASAMRRRASGVDSNATVSVYTSQGKHGKEGQKPMKHDR